MMKDGSTKRSGLVEPSFLWRQLVQLKRVNSRSKRAQKDSALRLAHLRRIHRPDFSKDFANSHVLPIFFHALIIGIVPFVSCQAVVTGI